eukprot:TRINITY_DN37031_c0_g1_i1.p1 TRINITY_DN37031_c0_g1~~TRINITY_DN37031_c0_g1_i1.p1  ORF type:complete len:863 (+),score=130.70 TRINITY_DN37031_c0_g1_i1:313-2589(+)
MASQKLTAEVQAQGKFVEEKREELQQILELNIEKVNREVRISFEMDLSALREAMIGNLKEVRESLSTMIEDVAAEARASLNAQRRELDAIIEERRQQLSAEDASIRRDTASEFERVRKSQKETDDKQDAHARQSRAETDSRFDAHNALITENREAAEIATSTSSRQAAENLLAVRELVQCHLVVHDKEVENIWDACRELQELPTRRVEWVIPNAAELLTFPVSETSEAPQYVSWFSKRFRAAGTRNLRLELRLYSPSVNSSFKGGVGNIALALWCGRHMHMHWRTFVGNKMETHEQFFDVRGAHSSKRLCYLKDEIRADGTLSVGIELLEVICEIDDFAPSLRDGDVHEPNAESEGDPSSMEGSLLFHRHINHRLVPQMRQEIARMQARMVRRIEWQLEQATSLPQYFRAREPICSPIFAAAGIEGMQLMFYPSGYAGATDGFCSFFLYCPAGVTVKCILQVGNQVRDAQNTFEDAGAYGRTNFCRYVDCFDAHLDTLVLAFEISDIQQQLGASSQHAIPADGAAEKSVVGAVKMLRVPGRQALTETTVLPALWTSKGLGDVGLPPEGFQPWSALKAKRSNAGAENPFRPVPSGRVGSPSAGDGDGLAAQRGRRGSESMPSLQGGNGTFREDAAVVNGGYNGRGAAVTSASRTPSPPGARGFPAGVAAFPKAAGSPAQSPAMFCSKGLPLLKTGIEGGRGGANASGQVAFPRLRKQRVTPSSKDHATRAPIASSMPPLDASGAALSNASISTYVQGLT